MKQRTLLVGYFLFTILLLNFNIGSTVALTDKFSFVNGGLNEKITTDDADNDNIDDNFEVLNKRNIEVDVFENEATIQSTRDGAKPKDLIRTDINCGEFGVQIQISYKSSLESDIEITFGIVLQELIEFIDNDFDGVFDSEIDQRIQNYTLKDFSPIFYEKTIIQGENFLHHFRIQTVSNNFTLNIYFAEEFTVVEKTLINPTQAKIDIEIANYNYLNSSSQIALSTILNSDADFQKHNLTEDEKNSFAKNEDSVKTTINEYTGFYSWNEIGIVDESSQNIFVSDILPVEFSENGKIIYFNYPRGVSVYHSSKIGIEGLLKTEEFPLLGLVLLFIAIGAVSSIVIYSVYDQEKKKPKFKAERRYQYRNRILKSQEHEPVLLFDSKLALQILEEEDAIANLQNKGDINITAISNDFYETIENFGLQGNEKIEFINEMLSLSPFERELILRDMLIESQ